MFICVKKRKIMVVRVRCILNPNLIASEVGNASRILKDLH